MEIVIIDYGAGNVRSVQFALERLGYEATCTNDRDLIEKADKVIFPGVGEAQSAMAELKRYGLDVLIPQLKQPVLGICLGMQLLCSHSEENDTPCLDIIPVEVKRFEDTLKVPHIGWNTITNTESDLFGGIEEDAYVYYVHSYYIPENRWSIASTDYGIKYCGAIKKNNFYACQFHPEKSASTGALILKNFIEKCEA